MAKIITFDGHDSVGKTSLITSGLEKLSKEGFRAYGLKSVSEKYASQRGDNMRDNIALYLQAWQDTEETIEDISQDNDFILVDRSYRSTQVLAQVMGIPIPTSTYEGFKTPDLAVRVTLDEDERIRRMHTKEDLSAHDSHTINKDLIRRANEVYDSLGFIELNNGGTLNETTDKLYMLIMSLQNT